MTGLISLHDIKLESSNGYSRLLFYYDIDGVRDQIYFEVESKYGEYLCYERADAFIICTLPYAMMYGFNIVSNALVTEELLYNLNMYLVPTIIKYNSELFNPNIDAPTISTTISNNGSIGISFSAGVDSFYTVLKHIQSGYYKDIPVYLFSNDISGLLGSYEDKDRQKHFNNMIDVSRELGLSLVIARSNIISKFQNRKNHFLAHDAISSFGFYCLQKLWSIHLYSSEGVPLNICNIDCTFKIRKGKHHDDHFFLNYFSTKNLRIYSFGIDTTRQYKIEFIADFPIVQKHLSVCLNSSISDNTCPKCRRTILALDAAGKLDKFGTIFDLKYYKNNKQEYYQYMFDRVVVNKDPYFKEILIKIKDQIPKEKYENYLSIASDKLQQKSYHKPEIIPFSVKYKRKFIRIIIKVLVDKTRYKKLKNNPNAFFNDSKSNFIKFLEKFYK